jgi:hypothetical protein
MSYPNGTLLHVTGNDAIYLMLDGQACWVPDLPTANNLFTTTALQNRQGISQADFSALVSGPTLTSGAALAQGVGQQGIYLISWGQRCGISSSQVFENYGFNASMVQPTPVLVLNGFPQGVSLL